MPTENGKKCGVSFKPVSSSFRNLKRTMVLTIKKIMVVVIVMTTTIISCPQYEKYSEKPVRRELLWVLPDLRVHVRCHEVGGKPRPL